jgi:hypothetical protein
MALFGRFIVGKYWHIRMTFLSGRNILKLLAYMNNEIIRSKEEGTE